MSQTSSRLFAWGQQLPTSLSDRPIQVIGIIECIPQQIATSFEGFDQTQSGRRFTLIHRTDPPIIDHTFTIAQGEKLISTGLGRSCSTPAGIVILAVRAYRQRFGIDLLQHRPWPLITQREFNGLQTLQNRNATHPPAHGRR